MNKFINIHDRKLLNKILSGLSPKMKPLWGIMNPQQMIEHLIDCVRDTNGKTFAPFTRNKKEAESEKELMVYTDMELPRGIKASGVPEIPAPCVYKNLDEAIAQLNKELDDFENYFKADGRTAVHPGYGPLNYDEWVFFHGKHFTHHFKQFGFALKKAILFRDSHR